MNTAEFVKQLYSDLLAREATESEISYWVNAIDSNSLSASKVTSLFTESQEYQQMVVPIARLYYTLFGRMPDAQGLDYWVKDYQNGFSLDEIIHGFLRSQEFQQIYQGADSNSLFLDTLYQRAFGRTADSQGKQYWLEQMDKGMDRVGIVKQFAASAELIQKTDDELDSVLKYLQILQLEPTSEQLSQALSSDDPITFITTLYVNEYYQGVSIPYLNTQGAVIDGYIAGATVFIDENADNRPDVDEQSVKTDEKGQFDFGENAGFGRLVISGGTDISTDQPFEGTMSAPSGATVVSPLTTLVDFMVRRDEGIATTTQAVERIQSLFAIDESIDLLNFDPIQMAVDSNTSQSEKQQALALHKLNVMINTVLGQTAALLHGAGVGDSEAQVIEKAYQGLAQQLASDQISAETFTDSTWLASFIADTAENFEVDEDLQQPLEQMTVDAAQTISHLTQAINAVSDNTSNEVLTRIAAIQIVAEDIENSIQSGAGGGDISHTVDDTSGSTLDKKVSDANKEVGDVDGDGTADNSSDDTTTTVAADVFAPTATIFYSTDTSSTSLPGNTTIRVKNGDTLRIFASFNESILDSSGATISIDAGTSTGVTAAAMTRVSATLYYYDYSVPAGDVLASVDIGNARDSANNLINTTPAQNTFTIDNTAPATIVSIDSIGTDTGSSSTDFITSDNDGLVINATLSAELTTDETLQYSNDKGASWVDVAATNISAKTVSLPDNSLTSSTTIQFRVTDDVGNNGSVSSQLITIDTTAPVITSVTSSWGSVLNATEDDTDGTVSIVTSGVEDGQSVSLSLNGKNYTAAVNANGASVTIPAADLQALNDASTYTISTDVADVAGNAATTHSSSFSVDTTTPATTVTINSISDDTGISSTDFITSDNNGLSISATLSAALASDEFLQYSNDSGASWSDISAFVSGSSINYTDNSLTSTTDIQLRFVDSSGNSAPTASQTVIIDTTPPNVIISRVAYNRDTDILSFTGSGFDALVADGTASGESIVTQLDWSKFLIDVNDDDATTADVSLSSTDIISATAVNDGLINVKLTTGKAAAMESDASFGLAGGYDTIDMAAGFTSDVAGNRAVTDAITEVTYLIDATIVVFDTYVQANTKGSSSPHSGRTFDPDTSYTIYVRVFSDSTEGSLAVSDKWKAAANLGVDDKIILVGSGGSIVGPVGYVNNLTLFNGKKLAWSTSKNSPAAVITPAGDLLRSVLTYPGKTIKLWTDIVGSFKDYDTTGQWLTYMPPDIMRTQSFL